MASAIACDICGEETAVMMQSNLSNGDSQAIGQQCLLTFSLRCALAFADGIPPEVGAGFRELLAALVTVISPDLLAPEKPAKAPRKPKAAAEDPTAGAIATGPTAIAPTGNAASGDPEAPDEGYKSESAEI